MKLELKHLAPYLPYGLKMKLLNFPFDGHIRILELDCGHDFHFYLQNNYVRPFLRPLSDLTKEIEVNGKKFVPTKHLEKLFLMEGLLEWKTTEYGWTGFTDNKNNNIPVYMDNTIIDECSLGVYNKLIKWHFDVFGLIEAGLAIDLNTVIPLTN